MTMELTKEVWTRADLFCEGLGVDGVCVLDAEDDIGMVSDVAPKEEDALRLALNGAKSIGWKFDLQLRRWLCPDCQKSLGAM